LTEGSEANACEKVISTQAAASKIAKITRGGNMKLISFEAEYKLSISYCLIALPLSGKAYVRTNVSRLAGI
jgi:hypothetical protein